MRVEVRAKSNDGLPFFISFSLQPEQKRKVAQLKKPSAHIHETNKEKNAVAKYFSIVQLYSRHVLRQKQLFESLSWSVLSACLEQQSEDNFMGFLSLVPLASVFFKKKSLRTKEMPLFSQYFVPVFFLVVSIAIWERR